MPSSATIASTDLTSFVPDTLIESSEVNNNFSVWRGHNLPVSPNTSTAADNTYDLGSSDYRWRNIYASNIVFSTATASQPSWFKYTVDFSDFATAAASADLELFLSPAKGIIHGIQVGNVTQFTGGGITNYQISVGITGSLDKYATLISVNTSTVNQAYSILEMESFDTASSIRVQAVATGADLDSATAGEIDIYVLRSLLP